MSVAKTKDWRKKPGTLYIACDEMDMDWTVQDVATFDLYWRNGISLIDMARAFERDINEIVILTIDRALKGAIEPREGAIFGKVG